MFELLAFFWFKLMFRIRIGYGFNWVCASRLGIQIQVEQGKTSPQEIKEIYYFEVLVVLFGGLEACSLV
jgi:hypothetical protein